MKIRLRPILSLVVVMALPSGALVAAQAPEGQAASADTASTAEASASAGAPTAEAQPVEAQPVEAQPVEPQPVEPQPVEPQPVAAQPTAASADEPDGAASSVAQDDLPPALRTVVDVADFEPTRPRTPPRAPWRVVASLGVGTSLRIVRNLELQQERFAPAFLTLRGGVALPQRGRFGHELAVGVSANLSGDGSYTSGVDPFQQWTLTPSYGLRVAFPAAAVPDWILRARVGLPMSPAPDFTWGAEVDASITHQLLAGLGVTVELGSSTFFGAKNRNGNLTVHPLIFATLGVTLDWEVLR
ncbi:MAG: hypothetical protein KF901_23320 [Myxococcales bacterium]|nr:hypothetical protein [Myxococcales bacterium]